MPNENKGGGAFNTGPLDAGPEQGGSNLGGLGATGAIDRDRDPEAEGFVIKKPATGAREAAVIEEESDEIKPDGGLEPVLKCEIPKPRSRSGGSSDRADRLR